MTETLPIISAFIIGLMGSAHCIGMCGGISSALSLSIPTGNNFRTRQTTILLCYNVGRIASYGIAGLLAGTLFTLANFQTHALSWIPRLLAGLFMIAMGLYLTGWWQGLVKVEKFGQILWKHIEPYGRKLMPAKTPSRAFLLGMVWGWLPCGLVYSTLILAAGQSSPGAAAMTMLSFGAGTIPAVLGVGYLSRQLNQLKNNKLFPILTGCAVIAFGIWTLPIPR